MIKHKLSYRKQKIFSGVAVFVFFLLILALRAFSTDYIETVDDPAFEKRIRPAVVFYHDDHNDRAGIDDCSVCHHVYENGIKTADMSVGMACSDCHMSGPAAAPDLIRVYHLQCRGCHLSEQAGPVTCGGCHKK